MSTLKVTNAAGLTGTSTNMMDGLAKNWAVFKGDGTAALRNSVNYSSLTDNGTGDYTLSFTNSYSSIEYVVGGSGAGTVNSDSCAPCGFAGTTNYRATGNLRSGFAYFTSNSLTDRDYINQTIHGDLA